MDSKKYKGFSTAVIVGRFQTPYLHKGHKHLIDTALLENDLVMIYIGVTKDNKRNERNPYDSYQIREMILREYPTVLIGTIQDEDDDLRWSQKLDSYLDNFTGLNVKLYGSRDSFHSHYKGHYPYREVEEIPGISATKIREELKNKQNEGNEEIQSKKI